MMARAGLFSFSLALPRPPSCLWVGGWCVCVWWMKAAAATWGGSRESSGLWSSSPPLSLETPPLGFRRQKAMQSVCVGVCVLGRIPHTPHNTTLPSFDSPFHLLSISPPPFSGSFPPLSPCEKKRRKAPRLAALPFDGGGLDAGTTSFHASWPGRTKVCGCPSQWPWGFPTCTLAFVKGGSPSHTQGEEEPFGGSVGGIFLSSRLLSSLLFPPPPTHSSPTHAPPHTHPSGPPGLLGTTKATRQRRGWWGGWVVVGQGEGEGGGAPGKGSSPDRRC